MSLIKSIGLYWDTEDVHWGRGRQAGSLLGVPDDHRSSEPIDFRQQVGIYVLYADFKLVYVGQAGAKKSKLFARLKKHRRDHLANRWNRFSWFGVRRAKANGDLSATNRAEHPQLGQILNHLEAILIETAEPHLNSQSGRFGRDVTWYLQQRDKRLGPRTSDMIRDIWDELD